jgi:uncharacterized protein
MESPITSSIAPDASPTAASWFDADGPIATTIRTALPTCLAIYAFGRRAQTLHHTDSDLDLAVLVAGYADPRQLW